jgi:hypothetical protein
MPIRRRLRSLWTSFHRLPECATLAPSDVTIIVLNWNNRDVTLECVESLRGAQLGGARILVVDNGSSDGSADALRERFPDVAQLVLQENRGYAGGNNAGVRAAFDAGARAVLLLNNDTRVAPEFLAPLLEVLNGCRDAAAVSSAIMRLDSPQVLQEAYFEVYWGFGLIRRRGVNALPGEGFDQVRAVDAAIGCSLLVRREALEHVGLLDDAYFAYHEEVEWCVRARKAGWRVFYQPYSLVYHHFSKSTDVKRPPPRKARRRAGELPNPIALQWNPVRTYLGARNAVRFIRRHASIPRSLYFWGTTLRAIPLELLAAVTEREEELSLGKLGYVRALAGYCWEQGGGSLVDLATRRPTLREVWRTLRVAPRALWRDLPADVRRARAAGRLQQVDACIRGHVDGWHDRPLPLEELGLRGPARS